MASSNFDEANRLDAECGGLDLRQVEAIVTDTAALRRVTVRAVAGYVAARGWVEAEAPRRARRWLRPRRSQTRDTWELVVPAGDGYADHAVRMAEALTTLAVVEGRSQLAVLADLLTATRAAKEDE